MSNWHPGDTAITLASEWFDKDGASFAGWFPPAGPRQWEQVIVADVGTRHGKVSLCLVGWPGQFEASAFMKKPPKTQGTKIQRKECV